MKKSWDQEPTAVSILHHLCKMKAFKFNKTHLNIQKNLRNSLQMAVLKKLLYKDTFFIKILEKIRLAFNPS